MCVRRRDAAARAPTRHPDPDPDPRRLYIGLPSFLKTNLTIGVVFEVLSYRQQAVVQWLPGLSISLLDDSGLDFQLTLQLPGKGTLTGGY